MMVSWDDALHCVEALTFIRGSGVARFGIYSAVGFGFPQAVWVPARRWCRYGVLSLVEPHPTDESAFCDSMGSATVSRLGGLALPHLDLTDLFVSL